MKNGIRYTFEDKIYYSIVYVVSILLLITILYPVIVIVSSSFSSPQAVSTGQVVFLPVEPGLQGYAAVFRDARVPIGYRNTIFYTVSGTLINIALTLICAYPLARKQLPLRGFFMVYFAFTMLFGGGMIPNYILVRDLRMLNTIWAIIIPGGFSVFNMIITRTFISSSIPGELLEATQIDGCNDFKYFFLFILPLSKPVIAVMAIRYGVGHWNSFFSAFLYLTNSRLFPLQVFLREILILSQFNPADIMDPELAIAMQGLADLLKYSLIVISTAPILCIYPFFQKYFVKGVMIGSLKG